MGNEFRLSSYLPFGRNDIYQTEYIFHYNLLVAEKSVVEKYTNRWIDRLPVLHQIQEGLISNSDIWQDSIRESTMDLENNSFIPVGPNPFRKLTGTEVKQKYIRDLRGIRINDSTINSLFCLQYTKLDYSLIENSKFVGDSFRYTSLNHCRFTGCNFENCNFTAGEYKHIIFYCCNFKRVAFNKNWSGIYSHILFQNCKLSDVDFSNVDIKSFCFFGNCEFENIKLNINDNYESIVGSDIIKFSRAKDRETYRFRKTVKGTTGNGDYIYLKKVEKRETVKYFYSTYLYRGLTSFYHNMYRYYENEGEYVLSGDLQYNFSYCKDEAFRDKRNLKNQMRLVINRNLLGYGWKYEKTLIFLFTMTFFASFIYLFSGFNYSDVQVKRLPSLNLSEFWPTVIDWGRSMYFSLKTTIPVGYGNFAPTSIFSLAISFIQGTIGFIVFTIFVVIFSRRFFK